MRRTVVLGILLLTLFEARIVWLMHVAQDPLRVKVTQDVYQSHPDSPTNQNSVLGPYLVNWTTQLVSRVFQRDVPLLKVLKVFELSMLLAANALAFWIGGWISREQAGGWALAAANALVFVCFQHSIWLYPWDLIDAVTMLAFAFAIWADADLMFFLGIFAVELLNREASALIPLWLIIDGIFKLRRGSTPRVRLQLVSGVLLLPLCITVTLVLRHFLYHNPEPGQHMPLIYEGERLPLFANLRNMIHPTSVEAVFPAVILLIFFSLFMRAAKRRGARSAPLLIFLGLALVMVLLFSTLEETRIWISIAPLTLPLIFDRQGDDDDVWVAA